MDKTQSPASLDGELAAVTKNVFETMLGTGIEVLTGWRQPGKFETTAFIALTGGWNGTLTVECSREQARCFASAMLGMSAEELEPADITDAVGEIANIVAGNLKVLFPGARLGLPSVIQGTDYALRVCNAKPFSRAAFSSPWGPFQISLFEEERGN